jgi:hypothetical protein
LGDVPERGLGSRDAIDVAKKRILMSTNTDPKSRRKKMKKFSPSENQALCRAYVNAPKILS